MMSVAKTIQLLADEGVEFVVIGGWAAIFHGSAHLTNDLDICFSRSDANLRKIVEALAPYNPRPRDFPPDLPFVWDFATLRNGTNFTLTTDLGAIDLLSEVTGIGGFEEIKAHSIRCYAFERDILTLDLPTLIRAKRASGREKDLRHLSELESLLESDDASPKPGTASDH